jgi:MFS transporter, DHA3 family, tetracycline resistance protein
VRGRRLSVIVGLCVIGTGIALMGAVPAFWCFALGSVLWGVGGTFISGAHQAWLADEIGEVHATSVYLRATQTSQIASLIGVPLAVALAWIRLPLPLWVGGAAFWGVAGFLMLRMTETGYRPGAVQRRPWAAVIETLRAGIDVVQERSAIRIVLLVSLIVGASGEAFGRLTPFHLLDDIGLPPRFDDATWFGVLQAGSFIGAAVVTSLVRRSPTLHTSRRIVQILFALTAVTAISTLVFAVASVFWLALIAAWVTRCVRVATWPLLTAWANRGLPPSTRATVLSTLGQAESFGEIAGGPLLGLVATVRTVRVALIGAAAVLLPAFPLYALALRRDPERVTLRHRSQN